MKKREEEEDEDEREREVECYYCLLMFHLGLKRERKNEISYEQVCLMGKSPPHPLPSYVQRQVVRNERSGRQRVGDE